MKKRIITILLSVFLILTITGCGEDNQNGDNNNASQSETQTQAAEKPSVSQEEARAAALKDAGMKEAEVTMTKQKLDKDDGHQVYEIDFSKDKTEYEYEIDAQTGKILKQATEEQYKGTAQSTGSDLNIDKAKSIALKKAGEASDTNMKIELEVEDGWRVYEGEIHTQEFKYEFEIDAITGDILSWSREQTVFDNQA